MHAHAARGIRCAHGSICARPRHQNPIKQNPPRKAGLHTRRDRGNSSSGSDELPLNRRFCKPRLLATGEVRPKSAASGRVALQPRRPFCSHSSPSPSTCTAPSAGICTGRCRTSSASPTAPAGASPPSARSLPPQGQPRSTVSRHLAQLAAGGRHRAPAAPWRRLCLRHRGPLPAGCAGGVPPARKGCPTGENRRTGR